MTCANCASVAQAYVITVYCDCGEYRHKVYDSQIGNSLNYASYIKNHTCPIPINNVSMYLWYCASVAHFI